MDFGSILEGSGRGLGEFSEGLEGFWMDFGRFWERFWKCLALFGPAGTYSLYWPPALIREASQCAGVPPPAWLNPAFLEVWAEGPTEWGSHVPSRAIEVHRTFSSWAPSWLQVRIFSQFVCIFFARCLEVAFFIVS